MVPGINTPKTAAGGKRAVSVIVFESMAKTSKHLQEQKVINPWLSLVMELHCL